MSPASRKMAPIRTVQDLLNALYAEDPQRNAYAIERCGTLQPEEISHSLVNQLVVRRRSPAQRVRIAKALERVGALSDPMDSMVLVGIACRETQGEVQESIVRLLAGIRNREIEQLHAAQRKSETCGS
jgi:hypothetical protein